MAMYTLSVCVCMYFASDQHDNIVSGTDGNLYNNTRIYVQESTSLFTACTCTTRATNRE